MCGYPAEGGLWLAEWSGGRWREGQRDERVVGARELAIAAVDGALRGLVVDEVGALWAWEGAAPARRIGAADPRARPALTADGALLAFKAADGPGLWAGPWGGEVAPIDGAESDAGPALGEGAGGRLCAFRALSGRQGGPTWQIGRALAVAQRDVDGWSPPLVVGGPIAGSPALARAFGEVLGAWVDPAGALRWAAVLGDDWSLGEVLVAGGVRHGPALTTYRGRLVCAWVDADGRATFSAGEALP